MNGRVPFGKAHVMKGKKQRTRTITKRSTSTLVAELAQREHERTIAIAEVRERALLAIAEHERAQRASRSALAQYEETSRRFAEAKRGLDAAAKQLVELGASL